LGALAQGGCTVVTVAAGPTSESSLEFPAAVRSTDFDAVIFDDAIEHFSEPWRLLSQARELLREDGFVIAILPDVREGALRPSGRLSEFTTESIEDIFVRAGFAIERARSTSKASGAAGSFYEFVLKAYPSALHSAPRQAVETETRLLGDTPSELGAHDLVRAFEEMQQMAAAVEARVSEMSARRRQQEEERGGAFSIDRTLASRLDAARAEAETLRQQLAGERARTHDIEELLRSAQEERSLAEIAVDAERRIRLHVQAGLTLGRLALQRSAEHLQRSDEAWFELYEEFEDARTTAEHTALGLRGALESTRRERDVARTDYEHRISEFEAQLALATRVRAERELESKRLAEEYEQLASRERMLRERVIDAEQQLGLQTEEFVARLQAESAELATLIDVVQSSRFWKVKRWLSRLRARAFGR
jgi:SAM-dependent methyltransferase